LIPRTAAESRTTPACPTAGRAPTASSHLAAPAVVLRSHLARVAASGCPRVRLSAECSRRRARQRRCETRIQGCAQGRSAHARACACVRACVRAPLCSLIGSTGSALTWATRLYPYESKWSGVLAPVDPIQNAHCGRTAAGRRWVLTGYAGEFRPPALRADRRCLRRALRRCKRTCACTRAKRVRRPDLGHSGCIGVGHEVWSCHGGPVEVFARKHPCHSGRVGDASSMHARHDVRQGTRPSRQHSVQQHAAATCSINSRRSKRRLYQRESTALSTASRRTAMTQTDR
jgi:hypothetical protein